MGSNINLEKYAERLFKKKDINDIFAQTVYLAQGVMSAIDLMHKEIRLKDRDENLKLLDVERIIANFKISIHKTE